MHKTDPYPDQGDGDRTVIRPSSGARGRQRPINTSAPPRKTFYGESRPSAFDKNISNSLVDSAFSLLSLVAKLRSLAVHHDIAELQQRLVAEMRRFESRALQMGSSEHQIENAKYFLCALIDETVMNTPWGSKSGWGHKSLSILFLGEDWGGLKFFQTLNQLKQQPARNLALLELSYLCLSLGFQGKYRNSANGLQMIESERQDLYLLIQSVKGGSERTLSLNWQGLRDLRNPLGRQMPLWIFVLVVGAVLILAFLGFRLKLSRTLQPINNQLIAMSHNVQQVEIGQRDWSLKQRISKKDRFVRLLAKEIEDNKIQVLDDLILRITDAFLPARAEIRREFHPMLNKIAAELKDKEYSIQVIGHTDNRPLSFSARFKSNLDLSRARAENVKNLLNKYALLGNHIRSEGKGAFEPITNENTRKAWAVNRRVDIHIR